MRQDPIVTGRFRPGRARRGLEFLLFDGDPVGYLGPDQEGVYRQQKEQGADGGGTDQQLDRRRGQLPLHGVNFIPLVPELSRGSEPGLHLHVSRPSSSSSENLSCLRVDAALMGKMRKAGNAGRCVNPPVPLFPQETTKITLRGFPFLQELYRQPQWARESNRRRELERLRKERAAASRRDRA